MNCEICGGEIGDVAVLLPALKPDGSLNAMACLDCAMESSAYCVDHQRPHVGFFDGGTACIICIEEMVRAEEDQAEAIFDRFRAGLLEEEFERLEEWADPVSSLIGCSAAVQVLRGVITKALRSGQGIEEVVVQVVASKSADLLLPPALF